jgi:hypothetical protein
VRVKVSLEEVMLEEEVALEEAALEIALLREEAMLLEEGIEDFSVLAEEATLELAGLPPQLTKRPVETTTSQRNECFFINFLSRKRRPMLPRCYYKGKRYEWGFFPRRTFHYLFTKISEKRGLKRKEIKRFVLVQKSNRHKKKCSKMKYPRKSALKLCKTQAK